MPRLKSASKSLGASATARFQCWKASSRAPVFIATTPRPLWARAERGIDRHRLFERRRAPVRLPRCISSVPMFSSA